jgi:hypothetical protein
VTRPRPRRPAGRGLDLAEGGNTKEAPAATSAGSSRAQPARLATTQAFMASLMKTAMPGRTES